MLLFKKPFHEGLSNGSITLTYRRWTRAHVRVGGRYRCHPIGVLEVDEVSIVTVSSITAADAGKAGFATRDALVAYLAELGPLTEETTITRVLLHHGGDGDRVEHALVADLTPEEIEALRTKLAKMDKGKPWTKATLAIIEKNPRVAASKLAVMLGRDRDELKIDIRRLKKLGLTQSFEVGYEVSPRGKTYLAATSGTPAPKRRAATKTTAKKTKTKTAAPKRASR